MRAVAERSVLNARYLASLLKPPYTIPFSTPCMHEFVASAADLKRATGVRAMDVAKALLDEGLSCSDGLLPADRRGGVDDRAHRDGVAGDRGGNCRRTQHHRPATRRRIRSGFSTPRTTRPYRGPTTPSPHASRF